jgi:hypothetical protein
MNREMLKEAIAEAKTIKETAIASAKAALEEAFTPALMAEFANKLNEMDEEKDEKVTEEMADENYSMDEGEDFNLDEILAELGEGDNDMEEGVYEAEDDMDMGDMDMGDDMPSNDDLETMIKNILDQEISALIDAGKLEAGDDYEKDKEGGADEEEVDVDAEIDTDDTEKMDEEISIEELLAEIESLTIDEGKKKDPKAKKEDEKKDEKKEKKDDKEKELKEAYDAIAELKAELNEVNLLNAKLLYTNKIFKAKNLTESEKVRVLNTFDKAETVKEVKLVFETLTESLKATASKVSPIKESLGSASRTIAAAPKQEQIIEVNDAFARMQRLAGLRK